jgi:hypothetical protein
MKRYQEWAKHTYSIKQRLIPLALAGVLFVLILPYLLITGSAKIDTALNLPRFFCGAANIIAGILITVAGYFLGMWSIGAQMTLGTILAYLGIGVAIGSYSEMGIVLLFGSLLLLYVKLLEEKELEARFGEEYVEYKRKTPFLLPRLRRRL